MAKAKKTKQKNYGKELILDLYDCDPSTFNRKSIKKYFIELCEVIDMQREKLCWWDDLNTPPAERETLPHLVGTSAVQFIKTSSVVLHTLDIMKHAYINIFSCKEFDPKIAKKFTANWFKGKVLHYRVIDRKQDY